VCLGILYVLEKFYDYQFVKNGLAGITIENGNTYDYLFIGDSRVSSIKTNVIDSVTGLRGVAVANFGSSLGDIRETLEIFLAAGNRCKYVFMSIDPAIGSRKYVGKKFLYVPFRQYLGMAGLHFPFSDYARFNKNYSIAKLRQAIMGEWDPMRRHNPDQPEFRRRTVQFVDHSARKFHADFLAGLKRYCESKGIELVLYTAPYTPDYLSIQTEFSKYKMKIDSLGIPFFDYSALYPDNSYFIDDVHLRRSSEVLFSLEISKMVSAVAGL
jgi:hypothetical protein